MAFFTVLSVLFVILFVLSLSLRGPNATWFNLCCLVSLAWLISRCAG